MYIDTE